MKKKAPTEAPKELSALERLVLEATAAEAEAKQQAAVAAEASAREARRTFAEQRAQARRAVKRMRATRGGDAPRGTFAFKVHFLCAPVSSGCVP